MRVFSTGPHGIVLHARLRLVGEDFQAVLLGHLIASHVYAGAASMSMDL
jgi:hypothetical protein